MAQTVTFTTLQQDIRDYLERGFSAGADPTVFLQIPRLITLAERRLARDMKIQGFQNQVTTVLTMGDAVYPKPDRWRDTVSMNIGIPIAGTQNVTRQQLYSRSYEYLRAHFPVETDLGVPIIFGDYDYNHWIFAPTPNLAYQIEILYYELPPLLDDSRQTNWLTEYAPNALLYACLLEATPFLKNDERIPVWQQYYSHAVDALNREDQGKIILRGTVREGV